MKNICVKCKRETNESHNRFCHDCISKKAFQIHCRTKNSDALYNWFYAIYELNCEAEIYQWKIE